MIRCTRYVPGARTRRSRSQRGATLVETAIVFSLVLLPALLGIMGFGHALYAYHFVSHASKSAARWAVVNGYTCQNDNSCTYASGASATDIQIYATNMLPPALDSTKVIATATWPLQTGGPLICKQAVGTLATEQNYPGCTVQVTVSYAYSFIFPFLPVNSTATAPCTAPGWCLSSTSEMVILH